MALPETRVICTACRLRFVARPKRSFLAFQKFSCPACNATVIYPLTSGYRIFYQFAVVLMVLASLGALTKGDLPVPGLVGVAAIIALLKDRKIKKQVEQAEMTIDQHPSSATAPRKSSPISPAAQRTTPTTTHPQASAIEMVRANPEPAMSPLIQSEGAGTPVARQPVSDETRQTSRPQSPRPSAGETSRFCQTCQNEMTRRRATNGPHAGKLFWVCSAFPECKTVVPASEKV